MIVYYALVAVINVERLAELVISRRHAAQTLARRVRAGPRRPALR